MGLGTKAHLIGAILTFYSSFAAALGLGEIQLNSALNQPLDAEIQLLHVRDLVDSELLVTLASEEEFKRAGVEKSYFLHDLTFRVDLSAPSGPVIRVFSSNPVQEPFLNFLVTAQWPSGKLLREYTLLVDLPIFSGAKASPVNAATVEPSPRPIRRPSLNTEPARESVAADVSERLSGGEFGPVGANDTLWSIASKVRPDSSVSVQQTMLALQRLNPQAFIKGNINLIRRGQVLRVPDVAEIQAMSARDAAQAVAEQNRLWSEGKGVPEQPEQNAAQLEGSKSFEPTRSESSVPEGRVKLTSNESIADGSGAGTGDGTQAGGSVENTLAVTQEELDAAKRENVDLKSRLTSVEEQIDTMEKLVQIGSAEMKALEEVAKQSNQAGSEDPAVAQDPTATENPAGAEAEGDPAAADPTSEGEPVVDEKPAEPVAAPPAPVVPAKKSMLDLLMDNILYVAAGLGLIVVVVAFVLYMRSRDDGFGDELDDDFTVDYEDEKPKSANLEFVDSGESSSHSHDNESLSYPDLNAELSSEAETEDVAGECDIHIAYGQYEQAEEKLYRALEREPSNLALRLKLLEVFSVQSDLDNFDYHFAKIHALGDQEAIDRGAMLRESIHNAHPFDLRAHEAGDKSHLADLSRSPVADTSSDFGSESDQDPLDLKGDTLNFDVDLDAELAGLGEPSLGDDSFEKGLQEADLGDLDLDFGLLDDDPKPAQALSASSTSSAGVDSDVAEDRSVQPEAVEQFETSLDDLDFELDENNTEFSFDDVELDLDSNNTQGDSNSDDDFSRFAEESLSLDTFGEEPLASASDSSPVDDSQFDLDKAMLDLDFGNSDQDDIGTLDAAVSDVLGSKNALDSERADDGDMLSTDFDLDRDVGAVALDADDMDFSDLDIDDHQIDGGASSSSLFDDDDGQKPSAAVATDVSPDSSAELDLGLDLDSDFDIGDLDSLDKELDSLTSDLGDVSPPSEAVMDEPVTDFDDFGIEAATATTLSQAEMEPDFSEDDTLMSNDIPLATEVASESSVFDEDHSEADDALLEPEPAELSSLSDSGSSSPSNDFEIPDFDPENDDDSNLDFLSDNDETATKLDLARAYIDMGDADGAKDILDEIVEEGNEQQKQEASQLLARLA